MASAFGPAASNAEDVHPDAFRTRMLVTKEQEAEILARLPRGTHVHYEGEPPAALKLPKAKEGEVWLTVCSG